MVTMLYYTILYMHAANPHSSPGPLSVYPLLETSVVIITIYGQMCYNAPLLETPTSAAHITYPPPPPRPPSLYPPPKTPTSAANPTTPPPTVRP